jgi:hypothetical protein
MNKETMSNKLFFPQFNCGVNEDRRCSSTDALTGKADKRMGGAVLSDFLSVEDDLSPVILRLRAQDAPNP